jgi:tetratricopeptide (TPR) repeat protein
MGLGRTFYRRSRIEERLGGYSRALYWATRSRKVLLGADDTEARYLAAEVGAWYANILHGTGRSKQSQRWARVAIEEAEATGNKRALADAYDVLDQLNHKLGLPTGEHWERALAIFEELGDLRAQQRILGNLGAGCYVDSRWDEAMEFNARSHELSERIGDVISGAIDLINMAEIELDRGALDEAEALLRESLRVWRACGYHFFLGGCLDYLGRAVSRLGRFDEALEIYEEAVQAFEQAGAREYVLEVKVRIAECFTFRMDPQPALELLDEVAREPDDAALSAPLAHLVRGYALAQLGDAEGASRQFRESEAVSRDHGADFDVAMALTGLVRLATMDGARPDAALVHETNAILERLRIAAVTYVPLPGS